jgi:peptide/nickel transport system permease protein
MSTGGNWSLAAQLVMPVLVIALYDVGYLIAMIRVSMIAVMRQPFIRTAVLKGMNRRDVIVKHALRNALIAPFTAILLQVNYLVAGVVVVETVFAYPGFGRLMLQAAMSKDIALIEAGTLVAVLIAMTTQLVGDLAYMLLDPRIRVSR